MKLLAEFYSAYWALDAATFQAMDMVINRWATGARLSPEEIRAAVGDAPQAVADRRAAAAASGGGGVAVLPVYGVLTHRGHSAQQVSTSLASTEIITSQVRALVRDPGVAAVVMDFDSPGGSVLGVQELGDAIYALRGEKPIVGVANATAASGAYWAISQCDEVVVTPSGWVGSIGVLRSHRDLSAALEKAGVKEEYIFAGANKAEGNPTGPMSDATRAHFQAQTDAYYAMFTKAVARGRGAGLDQVRSEAWGQGRMVLAADAVKVGLADRVDTFENTLARLGKPQGRRAAMSAHSAQARIRALQAGAPIEV
jgi:signal peptide peptidase SppA